jgi:nucleotide-binding universal stress UspA family protein
MFKTVVWATDGSDSADRALPYAKELAAEMHGRLVAVFADERFVGRSSPYAGEAAADELKAKIHEQVEQARAEGLEASFRILPGLMPGPAHLIADAAREEGADAIVVGPRGHGAVTSLVLGSVTQRLLHIAPCPVLVIPSHPTAGASPDGGRDREELQTGGAR